MFTKFKALQKKALQIKELLSVMYVNKRKEKQRFVIFDRKKNCRTIKLLTFHMKSEIFFLTFFEVRRLWELLALRELLAVHKI